MIVYNPLTGRFEINDGVRTQTPAMPFVRARANSLPSENRPWGDRELIAQTGADLDLSHLVSFSDIEDLVVTWLNSPVTSFTWFIDGTTTLFTPSWADVFNPSGFGRFLQQRFRMYFHRLVLMAQRGLCTHNAIAAAANQFVRLLNLSEFNLRPGHRSTNRAVGPAIDPRLDLGFTIDPISLLGRLFARFRGVPAFSTETSLAMSHFPRQLSIVSGTGAIRASTETAVVGRTRRTSNPVRGIPVIPGMPVRNYLRRHVWFIPLVECGTLFTLVLFYFFVTYLWACLSVLQGGRRR